MQFDIDYSNIKTIPGSKKLKAAGQSMDFTEDMLREYTKCSQDIVYFIENYFHCINLDKGLILMKLWDKQAEVLRSFQHERFNCICASRQIGKTLMYSAFVVWCIVFQNDKKIALLANKQETVKEILRNIKRGYEELPMWLQQGIVEWNKESIIVESDSSVKVYATSSDNVRGLSCNVLIIDEVGIIRQSIWYEFAKSAFPSISSGLTTKIILASTPKGLNHFHEIVTKAKLGKNKYVYHELMWTVNPVRTQAWFDEEVNEYGMDYVLQEYCCKFLGASNTLISNTTLDKLAVRFVDIVEIDKLQQFNILKDYHKYINIYELPKVGHNYIIGGDTCTTSDEENRGDSTSLQILDITNIPFVQVGACHFIDSTSYLEIPNIELELSKIYNKAWIFNENNDGSGREINSILNREFKYDKLYWDNEKIPGFRTTPTTKINGCKNLKRVVENNFLVLNDRRTIEQFHQYAKFGNNGYKAKIGFDDAIAALLSSIYFLLISQNKFDKLFDMNMLPDIIDLLKIIHTSSCDAGDYTIDENNRVIFNNNILNNKKSEKDDIELVWDSLLKHLNTNIESFEDKMKKSITIINGKREIDNSINNICDIYRHDNANDVINNRIKTIDDYLFGDDDYEEEDMF